MRTAVNQNTARAVAMLRAEFKVGAGPAEPDEARKLWAVRRAALPGLMSLKPTLMIEDVTVPGSKLSLMAGEITKAGARHGVRIAAFGHAGDGNLHPVFLTDSKDAEEMARVKTAISEVRQVCIDLDGVVSAEKGIGLGREPYRKLEIGHTGYEVMKSLKDSLDPRGIMNPGKMFNEE
jgi:glycolate oxidase